MATPRTPQFNGWEFAGKVGGGLKAGGKILGTLMLASGAAGVALAYDAVNAKPARRIHDEPAPLNIPPLLTAQDLVRQPLAAQEDGPVDGYGANQWRDMVKVGRGQSPEQQVIANAQQPRMSVGEAQDATIASKTLAV